MTYKEALEWLFSTQLFGIKLGLDGPKRLLRESRSFPTSEVKVIHVAGTNGKGSVCAMIDSVARAENIKTGLFTSPHLIDFRERIRVSGVEIPEDVCTRYITEFRELVEDWEHHPTFFELTLAIAMRYFRKSKCELIILETGMGGKLDATTAVPANTAVITPIDLDHVEWLGDTLEKIANEKAGIIVKNKPTVSSQQKTEAANAIKQAAQDAQSPLTIITEPLQKYAVNIPGHHQKENAALAIEALKLTDINLSNNSIEEGLKTVNHSGRFERFSQLNHTIVLDGAHNPHAAKSLVETWRHEYPNQKPCLIFGAVSNKDISGVLSHIAPIADTILLTPLDSPRSVSTEKLISALPQSPTKVTETKSLEDALKTAVKTDNPILIAGSLFLVGQARALLKNTAHQISSQ